jgi:GNAT superfamily N-acetyltransferase
VTRHAPGMKPGHTIIPAESSDAGPLSVLIAEAFHSLEVSRWLVPDGACRREIFPAYFSLYAERALTCGLVHTTGDRDGAALWIPGNAPDDDEYPARLAEITGPFLDRFLAFDEALQARHPDPDGGDYEHLTLLAVRPGRQGQGIGTRLLEARHAELDTLGIPAYLDASDQRTRQMYLSHGYADHGAPIQLPDGPAMYPMLRDAAGSVPGRISGTPGR